MTLRIVLKILFLFENQPEYFTARKVAPNVGDLFFLLNICRQIRFFLAVNAIIQRGCGGGGGGVSVQQQRRVLLVEVCGER